MVEPPVYSTTGAPSARRPSNSGVSIIESAIRSFMEPVGFSFSSLRSMRAPLFALMLRRGRSVVLPMESRIVCGMGIAGTDSGTTKANAKRSLRSHGAVLGDGPPEEIPHPCANDQPSGTDPNLRPPARLGYPVGGRVRTEE